MTTQATRSLVGLVVLWFLEVVVAGSWVHLLWWQRQSTGLSFGLLGLGLCLVPLHLVRLAAPLRSWTWASFGWELTAAAMLRLGLMSALPLGYVLPLALYTLFPADSRPAEHSRWRWLTRAPLILTLFSLLGAQRWPTSSHLALVPWLVVALESESGPAPRPWLALARASGVLTLLALVSQVDLPMELNRLVVLSFGYAALERYWHSGNGVLPRPTAEVRVVLRLLALGFYCYVLPDPTSVRIACALFVIAGCFTRWHQAPARAARVAGVIVVVLACFEVAAWRSGVDPTKPLPGLTPRVLSRVDYFRDLGEPSSLRHLGGGQSVLTLHGQVHELDWNSGYRTEAGRTPSESSRAAVGSLVAVLGDEAAFGLGVGEGERCSRRLSELLGAQRPTEVTNFGTVGANSAQGLHLAYNLDARLGPDWIVWLLRSDDLLPHSCERPYETEDAWSLPVFRRLTAPALERTYLGALLCAPYDAALRDRGLRNNYLANVLAPDSRLCYHFGTGLHEINDSRRRQGRTPIVVVVLPGYRYRSPPAQREACLRLEAVAEEGGARVVRIPGLAEDRRAWLEWAPLLPSAEGHARIAAALADALGAPDADPSGGG